MGFTSPPCSKSQCALYSSLPMEFNTRCRIFFQEQPAKPFPSQNMFLASSMAHCLLDLTTCQTLASLCIPDSGRTPKVSDGSPAQTNTSELLPTLEIRLYKATQRAHWYSELCREGPLHGSPPPWLFLHFCCCCCFSTMLYFKKKHSSMDVCYPTVTFPGSRGHGSGGMEEWHNCLLFNCLALVSECCMNPKSPLTSCLKQDVLRSIQESHLRSQVRELKNPEPREIIVPDNDFLGSPSF